MTGNTALSLLIHTSEDVFFEESFVLEISLDILFRNSKSFSSFTNFTSLSGTSKKLSYYTFFNFKEGKGFRPNSNFNSKNSQL